MPLILTLTGSLWRKSLQLGLGVVADRLVRVEEAGLAEHPRRPAVRGVAGDGDRAIGERLGLVVELGQVDVGRVAHALAARTHAAGDAEASALGLAVAALDGDRPAARDRGDVERERLGPADVRLPDPAEDDPQHRVGVGDGADGGADVGAHPLLVEDDRGRQPFERVDVGPGQRRHEALHEGAVGLVDQPLRLRGDRLEHERALARARDAGEHREAPLRDVEADVAEVVLAGAADLDRAPTRVVLAHEPMMPHLLAAIREFQGLASPSSQLSRQRGAPPCDTSPA